MNKPNQNPYKAPDSDNFEGHFNNSNISLNDVMSGQQIIIYAIIGNFLSNIIIRSTESLVIVFLSAIIVIGMGLYGVWKVSSGLNYHIALRVLLLLLLFIPLINIIALVLLNGRATKALKEGGYEVGLFGVKR